MDDRKRVRPTLGFVACRPASLVDGDRERRAIGFAGRRIAERRVRSAFVVKMEVGVELGVGIDQRAVAFEVNLLVFHTPPQPFDEHVVQTPALAIHRQLHVQRQERLRKLGRGELAALVLCGAPSYVE